MTPVVNGKTHRFGVRGLYNGLLLMGDYETGSYWDHITGTCLHGPLKGYQLEIHPLLHMNVAQALAQWPEVHVAISSELNLMQRLLSFFMVPLYRSKWAIFPPVVFKKTMGKEDTRRKRMDLGLGVWTKATHRFYPLEMLHKQRGALIDELDDRRILVYIDPTSNIPAAIYTNAIQYAWHNEELKLDNGEIFRGGKLYNTQGVTQAVVYPMQMLTRWYGFALTFPGCQLHQA